jgi:hypothetical protein
MKLYFFIILSGRVSSISSKKGFNNGILDAIQDQGR